MRHSEHTPPELQEPCALTTQLAGPRLLKMRSGCSGRGEGRGFSVWLRGLAVLLLPHPIRGASAGEARDPTAPFPGCSSEAREFRGAHPRTHAAELPKVWDLGVLPLPLLGALQTPLSPRGRARLGQADWKAVSFAEYVLCLNTNARKASSHLRSCYRRELFLQDAPISQLNHTTRGQETKERTASWLKGWVHKI